jgi:hypothetical protein
LPNTGGIGEANAAVNEVESPSMFRNAERASSNRSTIIDQQRLDIV